MDWNGIWNGMEWNEKQNGMKYGMECRMEWNMELNGTELKGTKYEMEYNGIPFWVKAYSTFLNLKVGLGGFSEGIVIGNRRPVSSKEMSSIEYLREAFCVTLL